MTTETNLSAEEPSERASTGPQHIRVTWENTVNAPGGTTVGASGSIEVPSGGDAEGALSKLFMAVAAVVLLAGAVLLPAAAGGILAAAGVAVWLIAVIAGAVLISYVAIATVVLLRKGWFKN